MKSDARSEEPNTESGAEFWWGMENELGNSRCWSAGRVSIILAHGIAFPVLYHG